MYSVFVYCMVFAYERCGVFTAHAQSHVDANKDRYAALLREAKLQHNADDRSFPACSGPVRKQAAT